jgi:ABC-type nitrate/sulfonate/bicarbonate transport system permease component
VRPPASSWRERALNIGLAVVIFFGLWQLLAWIIARPILPPPGKVIPVFFELLPGELGRHLLVSAGRVLAAIGLAVITAAPAGLGLGQMAHLNRLLAPLIAVVHPIPKIVFLPVLLVLLGSGDVSKVLLITLILFFQILVVVRDEAAALRPELVLSVRSLGAGRRALFRYVYIPASLPAVLTALRVSVGTAVAVLFIAETFATQAGLGYYIVVRTWGTLRYPQMYAGILAMSLLGLTLYFAIEALDRRVNRHLYVA